MHRTNTMQNYPTISSTVAIPVVVLAFAQLAVAAVLPRDGTSDSKSSSPGPAIWVPILVIGVVVLAAIVYRIKTRARLVVLPASASTTTVREVSSNPVTTQATNGANNGVRELTADELAGRTGGTATPAAAGARRPRRNRRTPSQISTKSLPAYNRDPGDQELVIQRGAEDMEDDHEPHSGGMASVPENDSPRGSSDLSQHRRNYSAEPDIDPNTPLLQEDNTHLRGLSVDRPTIGESTGTLPSAYAGRPSMDTLAMTDESSTSLLPHRRQDSDGLPDPRGPTPAYQEVVLNDDPPQASPSPRGVTPPTATSPPNSANATSPAAQDDAERRHRRTSTVRSIFQRFGGNNSGSAAGHTRNPSTATQSRGPSAAAHARNGSALSGVSSAEGVRYGHRPSHSGGSSSVLHLPGALRSLHRMGSSSTLASGNLISPSMISLQSISAPLTHTLTRTEIVYPSGGPTPEQIKLISSREGLGRFGVPFGEDAVRYAGGPIPDYDTVLRTSMDERRPNASADSSLDISRVEEASAEPTPSTMAQGSSSPTVLPAAVVSSPDSTSTPVLSTDFGPAFSVPASAIRSRQNLSTSSRPTSVATINSFATAQESLGSRGTPTPMGSTNSRGTPVTSAFALAVEPPTPAESRATTPSGGRAWREISGDLPEAEEGSGSETEGSDEEFAEADESFELPSTNVASPALGHKVAASDATDATLTSEEEHLPAHKADATDATARPTVVTVAASA